jgi:ABC-type nitrate/sulfonate/bicarbonate transport system substrate-binding protein
MRRLLIAMLLLAGLGVSPQPSHAGEKIRLALGPTGFALAPAYLAMALGMFEQSELDVERVNAPRPGLEIGALEGGQADFAFASGDALLSRPPGRPLSIVYAGLQRPIVNWVMQTEIARQRGVSERSPLPQKLQALRHLAVGVTTSGSLGEQFVAFVAAREGLKIGEDLRLVRLGGSDAWAAALKDGRANVGVHLTPFPEMAVVRGDAISLINYAKGEDAALSEFLMGALLVRTEMADQQGETVRRAVRALYQAVRWALANPPEKVAEILHPFMGRRDPRETLEGVKTLLPALNPHGRVTERAFATTADIAEKAGLLRRPARFGELVTNQFLPG